MRPAPRGLLCPVPTPFGPGGDAAPERLAAQIAIYAALPVDGIVLFGTSGEGPLLDDDEEGPLLAAARAAWPADRALVVQVGRESARGAARAAARAAAAGADALLCLPPRYYPLDGPALADYWRQVRAAADLPLLAYHIPQRTGVEADAAVLVALAREGTLAGIKDSAGDLALEAALREGAGPEFRVLCGTASATAAALAAGADGAILAVADAAPERAAEVLAAHAAGDAIGAERAAASLGPLAKAFGPRWGVPGIKAALDLRGWPGGGPPRAPLRAAPEEARREIADALRVAGVEVG